MGNASLAQKILSLTHNLGQNDHFRWLHLKFFSEVGIVSTANKQNRSSLTAQAAFFAVFSGNE
jgi:hypothetical protein